MFNVLLCFPWAQEFVLEQLCVLERWVVLAELLPEAVYNITQGTTETWSPDRDQEDLLEVRRDRSMAVVD